MAWSIMALLGLCAFCLMRIMTLLERIAASLERAQRSAS